MDLVDVLELQVLDAAPEYDQLPESLESSGC
ncbi:hypothetical protein JOF53_002394 [Crossiella equi]|uniref:Uncharacterized protein n=1 Tax=Crossiella equi TaxID=130796 RepID=A0ABS5AB54_9PSEU|nr:hypothetical protein [Crossiella equi]